MEYSALLAALLWNRVRFQGIGDEADVLSAALLQEHHRAHDMAVINGSVSLNEDRRLGTVAQHRSCACDDFFCARRLIFVVTNIDVQIASASTLMISG